MRCARVKGAGVAGAFRGVGGHKTRLRGDNEPASDQEEPPTDCQNSFPKKLSTKVETRGGPSINLLLRGNALVLEVSGRWGSKFWGLLQKLPYLAYIGQKLALI